MIWPNSIEWLLADLWLSHWCFWGIPKIHSGKGALSILWSSGLRVSQTPQHLFKCRLWDYVTVCQRLPSCLAACHPAHHLFGSSPPTPSIYPSVFCASLQSGGIVGQGHWDNPLVLCRINDRALSYTQLGPTTTAPPPSSSLALTDRLWLNSFSSRRLHLSVPFCGFSPCHRERPAFKTEGEKRIVYKCIWRKCERDLMTNGWFP